MTTLIEQELIDATGFVPRRSFTDNQDYLAALARAINELSDIDFDGLSSEAADWFNKATRCINNKKDILPFPDGEGVEETPAVETETEAPIDVAEVEAEPNEPIGEPEPSATRDRKPLPKAKSKVEKVDPIKDRKPPKVAKPRPEEIVMDKFGLVTGSKNHQAALMFERGCKMTDVTDALGGTYYNMLARLRRNGHILDKGKHGVVKITYVPR